MHVITKYHKVCITMYIYSYVTCSFLDGQFQFIACLIYHLLQVTNTWVLKMANTVSVEMKKTMGSMVCALLLHTKKSQRSNHPSLLSKGPIASKQRLRTSNMILPKVTRTAPTLTLGQHYIRGHLALTENHFNSTEESKNFDSIVGSNPYNNASISRLFQRSSITMLALYW